MKTYEINMGLDVGNGYTKGLAAINGKTIQLTTIPSCTLRVSNPKSVMPVDTHKGIEDAFSNIYNTIDVSFESNAIPDGTRRWVGERAINANALGMEMFEITGRNISKAEQPLSAEIALSYIAGTVLKQYYQENKSLPTDIIEANVHLALALPIAEYKEYSNTYKEKFKNHHHLVTIHNFLDKITIKINIVSAAVAAEGASAQYAISQYGERLYNVMIRDAISAGAQLQSLTAKHLANIKDVIGIDIGEGTVNVPVFTGGRFNADASMSIDSGYGTILTNAIAPCKAANHRFASRKALAEYLQNKPDPDDYFADEYNDVYRIVQNEAKALVNEIIPLFSKALSGGAKVAYVYGGGATPMRDILYPELIEASKAFTSGTKGFPILYVSKDFAQILNREGLMIMANVNAENTRKAAVNQNNKK